jgi:hypothetical protein
MARRWGEGSWFALFPTLGFMGAIVLTLIPHQPLSVADWPLKGPFGLFTWGAWFACTGLAFTLLLLAIASRLRPRPRAALGRLVVVAATFGLLALAAYGTAARADLIERYPPVALALALAFLVALRQALTRPAA